MLKTISPLLLALALPLTGCGETETNTDYPAGVAPIDENAPAAAEETPQADPAEQTEPTPDTPEAHTVEGLVYTVPEGWTVGGPRQMRVLTLDAGDGVEVAVGKWPNGVGGMESNLTRWLGQAGYNPADAASIAQVRAGFATITIGDAEATWMPLLDGSGGSAMIGLWVPRGENPTAQSETWTFKITGDTAALREKQDELRAWVRTLSFE